jgi:hypothetical protein
MDPHELTYSDQFYLNAQAAELVVPTIQVADGLQAAMADQGRAIGVDENALADALHTLGIQAPTTVLVDAQAMYEASVRPAVSLVSDLAGSKWGRVAVPPSLPERERALERANRRLTAAVLLGIMGCDVVRDQAQLQVTSKEKARAGSTTRKGTAMAITPALLVDEGLTFTDHLGSWNGLLAPALLLGAMGVYVIRKDRVNKMSPEEFIVSSMKNRAREVAASHQAFYYGYLEYAD